MAKDTFYFPHDFNSRNDPKIIALTMLGWEYVGLYWSIIEMLHEQGGWLNIDPKPIAFALRADSERIAKLINFDGIFTIKGDSFTSQRVLTNLEFRKEKSDKARKSAELSWLHRDRKEANAMRTHSEGNAIKGKERKGKVIKEKSVFTPPTLEEVVAYKQETLSIVDPQDFIDFYSSKGWKVGRESMKDWKAAFRRAKNWESNKGKENVTTKRMLS